MRAWVADASRDGASNLVSVSGSLGAGSRSASPRLRGSARVLLALLEAGRVTFDCQRVSVPRLRRLHLGNLHLGPNQPGP